LARSTGPGKLQARLLYIYIHTHTHTQPLTTHHRVHDWLHGVRAAAPPKETRDALDAEPLYEAERLRIIYQLITNPVQEGGAGITPKEGEWKGVESIFALHDHAYNKDWIKKWTSSYFLTTEDLDDIRNRLGEKVRATAFSSAWSAS
jgi:anoctamin-10